MNPEFPTNPREEMELRVTALLLGELSDDEAAAVREAIAKDPELAKLHDDLKQTIHLVREATASASVPTAEQAAQLQLSEERRKKLLTHFAIPPLKPGDRKPKPLFRLRLVEWAAVLAILAALAAISMPALHSMRTRGYAVRSAAAYTEESISRHTWGLKQASSESSHAIAGPAGAVNPANVVGYYNVNVATNSVQSVTLGSAARVPLSPLITPSAEPPGAPAEAAPSALAFLPSKGTVATVAPATPPPPAPPRPQIVLPSWLDADADGPINDQAFQKNQGVGFTPLLAGVPSVGKDFNASVRDSLVGDNQWAMAPAPSYLGRESESLGVLREAAGYASLAPPTPGTPPSEDRSAIPDPVRNYSVLPQAQSLTEGGSPTRSDAAAAVALSPTTSLPLDSLASGSATVTDGTVEQEMRMRMFRERYGGHAGAAVSAPTPTSQPPPAFAAGTGVARFVFSPPPGEARAEDQTAKTEPSSPVALGEFFTGVRATDDAGEKGLGLADGSRAGGFYRSLSLTAGGVNAGKQPAQSVETLARTPLEADRDAKSVELTTNITSALGFNNDAESTLALAPTEIERRKNSPADQLLTGGLRSAPEGKDRLGASGTLARTDRTHQAQGDVLLGDGSVRGFNKVRLQEALRNSGQAQVFEYDWLSRDKDDGREASATNVYSVGVVGYANVPAKSADRFGAIVLPAAPDVNGKPAAGAESSRLAVVPSRSLREPVPSSAVQANETPSRRKGVEEAELVLDLNQAVSRYAELSGRTLVRSPNLPEARITLRTQTSLPKQEAIQTLEAELAMNGIAMIPFGDKYLKAVPAAEGSMQGAKPPSDPPIRKLSTNAPIPQPEIQASENNFSTFSLNVSDVSFKLAGASLEKGQMPDAASVRSEEFINAFDYRDPEPAAGAPIAFAWERARYPFAHNRDLLRFSLKTAAAGRQAGRPLNVVLLLDNSGSMERADRVSIIREALRVLASQLQPLDRLSVITFSRTARLVADGFSGDKAGEVAEQVGGLTPQGGTNLEDAMNLAYQTAARHYLASGINRVVLLTDGAANLGNVEPDSLKQKVEAQRKQGIALDCFGIGWEGFNDDLLEVLSRNGDGRYGFINSPEEAATEFAGQLAGALKVAASDVKVQVEFNPRRVTSYRQIGYARHQLTKEQFRDNTVDAAEIAAQEAGNALYTVEVNPAGAGPLCTVRVRYKIPGTADYREQAWDVPFTGNALSLEQASPAMRLAAAAGAFSEWLVGSPFAGEVAPDALLGYLRGVPEVYGADARPKKLEWMIRQAKSLEGK